MGGANTDPLSGLLGEQTLKRLREMLAEYTERENEARMMVRHLKAAIEGKERPKTPQPLGSEPRKSNGRFNGVSKDQIYEVVRAAGTALTAKDVQAALALRGKDITAEATRKALARLVAKKNLEKLPDGSYLPWRPLEEGEESASGDNNDEQPERAG